MRMLRWAFLRGLRGPQCEREVRAKDSETIAFRGQLWAWGDPYCSTVKWVQCNSRVPTLRTFVRSHYLLFVKGFELSR